MDPGNIAAVSALFGSAIGALASLATSWSTHHYQDERQRSVRENVRRERIFVEFIDSASKAFVEALMQTAIEDPSRLIPLYATIGKLRLIASARTVEAAEQVMNRLVATYYGRPREPGPHRLHLLWPERTGHRHRCLDCSKPS